MPNFRYTVLDPTGKRFTKLMAAANRNEVAKFLQQNKYFIIDITETTVRRINRSTPLNQRDKISFTQNIAVLLSSGISLGEAVTIVEQDSSSKSAASFYTSIRNDLEQGTALSKALAHYPNLFDSVYISLIEAGENSGELSEVMNSLASSIEKDQRTLSQVKSALLYPAFILASLVGLGVVLGFFVLPQITKVFAQIDTELPFATRMLVSLSNTLSSYPIPILSGVMLLIAGILTYIRTAQGKKFISHLSTITPLIKPIILNLDLSRLSSTLALLLNAGVPIQYAFKIAAGTLKNQRLRQELESTAEKLASGISLSQSLQTSSLPRTFVALVAVGERSGKVAAIFEGLGHHYEGQLDSALKNFTSLLEPMMTLFIGLLVGGVVITIMVPIYQFVGNLQGAS
ncbi:MAG TPA: type II secretion system F family protein [Patescibacteria group bacterium]